MNWILTIAAAWLLVQMVVLGGGIWSGDMHWIALPLVVAPNTLLALAAIVRELGL